VTGALESVLLAIRDDLNRLALRMLGHPVDEGRPRRCTRMSVLTIQLGFLDPNSLLWKVHPARPRAAAKEALRAEVETMDALIERAFEVQRSSMPWGS